MRAADLRHQIEILTDGRIEDELGGSISVPGVFATLYGRKLNAREMERYSAGQLEGASRVVYEVRWVPGITTAMQARIDLQVHRITGIEDPDNGRQRRLHLVVERKAGDAA
jgi:head-tail adaptor